MTYFKAVIIKIQWVRCVPGALAQYLEQSKEP